MSHEGIEPHKPVSPEEKPPTMENRISHSSGEASEETLTRDTTLAENDSSQLEKVRASLGIKENKSVLSKEENKAIEELKEPIEKIVKELLPEIQAGTYNLLIGDDASGRIPTLILRDVISEIYKVHGHQSPEVRFIAGSSALNLPARAKKLTAVSEQINTIKKDLPHAEEGLRKVLLVTDTVQSGNSIRLLLEAVKKNGLTADVATIGIKSPGEIAGLDLDPGNKVVKGKQGVPLIYAKGQLSGVEKEERNVFSTPFKSTSEDPQHAQAVINAAREVASTVASKVLEGIRKGLYNSFENEIDESDVTPERNREILKEAIGKLLDKSTAETSESMKNGESEPGGKDKKNKEAIKAKTKEAEHTDEKHEKAHKNGGHGEKRDWKFKAKSAAILGGAFLAAGAVELVVAPAIIGAFGLTPAVMAGLTGIGLGAGALGFGSMVGLSFLANLFGNLWKDRGSLVADIRSAAATGKAKGGGGGGGGGAAKPKPAAGGGGDHH